MISADARVQCAVPSGLHAGAFSYVDPEAILGTSVHLGVGAAVFQSTEVGADSHLGAGTRVGPYVVLEQGVRLGTNVVVEGTQGSPTRIRPRAQIGSGCTVLAGVTVGHDAVLQAGASVDRDVPAHAVVAGNPARIVGYVDAGAPADPSPTPAEDLAAVAHAGVRWVEGVAARDLRGSLAAYEHPAHLPFLPARTYLVYGVTDGSARGEHAHKTCDEILVCVAGEIDVLLDTHIARARVRLGEASRGLYLPAMTWRVLINHTPGAVLLVLASEAYDPDEYIRDHADWEERVRGS
ncbi:MAG: isomerase [Frankiales bacterium]|nr:isomerase [Frankiales bacterium]